MSTPNPSPIGPDADASSPSFSGPSFSGAALVTGASRGLGRAIAVALGAAGWPVAVNYAHDDAGARRTVEDVERAGGRAIVVRFDVTDEEAVTRGVDEARASLGPIGVLVNNATGPQPLVSIEEQRWADHLGQLEFFVKAPLLLLQAVLPDFRAAGGGRVVNVGSEVVHLGNARFGHYVAAKAAMLGLTRSWAAELGPLGVTVNLVEPGWIPVERHADADGAALAEYAAGVPLGRLGRPEELAAAVRFLASPEAAFVTGQSVAVNGGKTFA